MSQLVCMENDGKSMVCDRLLYTKYLGSVLCRVTDIADVLSTCELAEYCEWYLAAILMCG
jgi:hypothetical protein